MQVEALLAPYPAYELKLRKPRRPLGAGVLAWCQKILYCFPSAESQTQKSQTKEGKGDRFGQGLRQGAPQ